MNFFYLNQETKNQNKIKQINKSKQNQTNQTNQKIKQIKKSNKSKNQTNQTNQKQKMKVTIHSTRVNDIVLCAGVQMRVYKITKRYIQTDMGYDLGHIVFTYRPGTDSYVRQKYPSLDEFTLMRNDETFCDICATSGIISTLKCGHDMCETCQIATAAKSGKRCPFCRKSFEVSDTLLRAYADMLEKELNTTQKQLSVSEQTFYLSRTEYGEHRRILATHASYMAQYLDLARDGNDTWRELYERSYPVIINDVNRIFNA